MKGRSEIVKSMMNGVKSLNMTAVDITAAESTASLRGNPMASCGGGGVRV